MTQALVSPVIMTSAIDAASQAVVRITRTVQTFGRVSKSVTRGGPRPIRRLRPHLVPRLGNIGPPALAATDNRALVRETSDQERLAPGAFSLAATGRSERAGECRRIDAVAASGRSVICPRSCSRPAIVGRAHPLYHPGRLVSSTCAGDRSRTPGAPEPADATSMGSSTGSAFDVPPNRTPVMNLKTTRPPTIRPFLSPRSWALPRSSCGSTSARAATPTRTPTSRNRGTASTGNSVSETAQ